MQTKYVGTRTEEEEEEARPAARAPAPSRERKVALGVRIDRATVQKVLAVAREFDVDKRGLYDAGAGQVQVWCSPTDKPVVWSAPITRGSFPEPRELVGALSWDWDGEEALLHVEGYPYELLGSNWDRKRWDLPEETWLGVMGWLKEKAWELVRLARMHETYLGCGCPFCEFMLPAGELVNGLVEHVADRHGEVKAVALGDGLTFEMKDGRRVRAREVTDLNKGEG
jgi:hypothetical protein